MSTTFEVYPIKTEIPSFKSVLDLSNQFLKDALIKYNISKNYHISVTIKEMRSHNDINFHKTIWHNGATINMHGLQ